MNKQGTSKASDGKRLPAKGEYVYSLDAIIHECERLRKNGFNRASIEALAEQIRDNCEPVEYA